MKTKEKKPQEIAIECQKEVADVLKKYNCVLEVDFKKQIVLGNPVLAYGSAIVYKGEKKK